MVLPEKFEAEEDRQLEEKDDLISAYANYHGLCLMDSSHSGMLLQVNREEYSDCVSRYFQRL